MRYPIPRKKYPNPQKIPIPKTFRPKIFGDKKSPILGMKIPRFSKSPNARDINPQILKNLLSPGIFWSSQKYKIPIGDPQIIPSQSHLWVKSLTAFKISLILLNFACISLTYGKEVKQSKKIYGNHYEVFWALFSLRNFILRPKNFYYTFWSFIHV